MNRYHWGFLGAASAAALTGIVACGSDEDDGACEPGVDIGCPAGGSGGSGGGAGAAGGSGPGGAGSDMPYCVANPDEYGCTNDGACFPTAASCYLPPDSDGHIVGDECMAQRDNSKGKETRIQYRQTWGRPVSPRGLQTEQVYNILRGSAALNNRDCNEFGTGGGWIQLLDTDLSDPNPLNHTTRTGYSNWVADYGAAKANGLCMIEDTYNDPVSALTADDMSPRGGWGNVPEWPEGLPDPMPMPWQVRPTMLKRIDEDFTVADKRTEFIQKAKEEGVDGFFYLEDDTGYNHSYVVQSWTVVYTLQPNVYAATPIREIETVMRPNDPTERSCIGSFRGDDLDPAANCDSASPTNPQWGCPNDTAIPGPISLSCSPGQGAANIKGYFLITELEQVRSETLGLTYCVLYPEESVATADGFMVADATLGKNCRMSDKWNPKEPIEGLPSGDWCAATNSRATPECHDAFRVENWQTFQGFPIRDATCGF
jgi:hypothetical protein